MHETINIREGNLFCYVFDDDAIIIHYFFGYKLKNKQVGFPKNTLAKILLYLEEKKVNYQVIGENEINKDFQKENQYKSILEEATNETSKNEIKQELLERINTLDAEQLKNLLEEL